MEKTSPQPGETDIKGERMAKRNNGGDGGFCLSFVGMQREVGRVNHVWRTAHSPGSYSPLVGWGGGDVFPGGKSQ